MYIRNQIWGLLKLSMFVSVGIQTVLDPLKPLWPIAGEIIGHASCK